MGIFKEGNSGGGGFERDRMPEGMYPARLVRIIGMGKQLKKSEKFGDKVLDQVSFWFEVPGSTVEINGEQMPRMEMVCLTNSLHEKAKLPKFLKSIDPTAKLNASFDEGSLLGKTVTLVIGEKGYIDQIIPDVAGMDLPDAKSSVFIFDFYEPTKESALALTEGVVKWISRATNFSGSKAEKMFSLREAKPAVKSEGIM
jgi:hypothetical protein